MLLRRLVNASGTALLTAALCVPLGCSGKIENAGGEDPVVDGGPDDVGPTCSSGEPLAGGALLFDGVDDYVTMGVAPELGLTEFTVEAWVRRDGRGKESGTGVGGVRMVPIAGKGRGENDQGNLNCNYVFGFAGDVLGADFEDDATGANHPVVGKTTVPYGEWHHVAATYDGATWRLYLDGTLDAERAIDATPRGDSIQHFGIGAFFNSKGVTAGAFHGAIDEVRVWNHARSAADIAGSMYTAMAKGDGLVGRWSLDPAEQGADSLGVNPGTIEGATFADDAARLDRGLPPVMLAPTPANDSNVTDSSVTLAVDVDDPEGDDYKVTYHLRELSEADDFTVVVLPDTQYYTRKDFGFEQFFLDQTQWARDNREAYNIRAVIHNGDITDHGDVDGYAYEWTVADDAISILETPEEGLAEGVPYSLAVGNHDNRTGTTDLYNQYFGVDRLAGRSYYGGHYGKNNDTSWVTFSAGTMDFVVVNIEYDQSPETPDTAVLEWARSIFEMHPDAFGILNSHYIVTSKGGFSAQGGDIYAALADVPNLQLMTSGHVTAERLRTETSESGNVIHSMVADYQSRYKGTDDYRGGSGYMRVWEFSPANDELTVRTYSPTLDIWETDENSEFTIPVDLRGAGGSFEDVATVEHAAEDSSTEVTGLEPGTTYEWYATVTDCEHEVETPVYRFTTATP